MKRGKTRIGFAQSSRVNEVAKVDNFFFTRGSAAISDISERSEIVM